MIKDFAINYAYDGFLYSPLILAKELGFLPSNSRLIHRNGDDEAIKALTNSWEPYDNWFAICDPFAHLDLSALPINDGDEPDSVCIVGAFIGRLPAWLYSSDKRLAPFQSEEDLRRNGNLIEKVVCYNRYNTGYLLGKHVNDVISLDTDKIREVPFGEELKNIQPTDLVVTSDVLAVAESLRAHDDRVKFSLFRSNKSLDPFLFTAILTRRSVVDKDLPTVLAVLSGLQRAVRMFEHNSLSDKDVDFLASRFANQIQHATTHDEKREKIRDGIRLLQEEKIFVGDLEIATAERGYNNASQEWAERLKRKHAEVENHKEPIPSLLMQNHWRSHGSLAGEFANQWKLKHPNNNSAVIAVAEAWRDDKPVITAVTSAWLKSDPSKQVLTALVDAPDKQNDSVSPRSFPNLAPFTAAAYAPVLAGAFAVAIALHNFSAARPALISLLLFMFNITLLAHYWRPVGRQAPLWWLFGFLALADIGVTICICRNAFVTDNNRWDPGDLWAAALAISGCFAAPILALPFMEKKASD